MKRVFQRKISTIELCGVLAVIELLVGSGARSLVLALLGVGFYYGRAHFKGDFSLADLKGLVSAEGKKP